MQINVSSNLNCVFVLQISTKLFKKLKISSIKLEGKWRWR